MRTTYTVAKMSQSEIASIVIGREMEKYLAVLSRETIQTLDAMQSHLMQLGPKRDEFKIGFLKSASYQLMAAYKRFEMKQMMNIPANHSSQNSLDFLLMPPPNMRMNTPFVMSGERMSGVRASRQANATPFLLNHNSSDRIMDLDLDPTNWYDNPVKMNSFGASKDANERVVFRTSGVNTTNGQSGTVNGFSMANGHSSATISTNTSNGHFNGQNYHENGSAITNASANNIFGGHQNVSNSSNAKKSAVFNETGMNDTKNRSSAENGLFGEINRFTGAKNPSNGHEKMPNPSSVFTNLNYNTNDTGRYNKMDIESSQNSSTAGTNKQKYGADFTNGQNEMDADENGFDNDDNGDIYVGDDEQNTNYGQNKFSCNIEATTATSKQQTNAANLFGTAKFTMNGPPPGVNFNQQKNSGDFKRNKASKREWMCYYCNEAREKNVENFVFQTVDKVYDHWKSNHLNVGIDHAKQKPFRFYSVDLLYCYLDSCGYFSTFQGLHRHHQKKHPKDLFVPIMNDRCALCLYSGNGLREHSCGSLQNGMQLKLYNPVLLTDHDLAELQSIECHELKENRPKQIECQHCGCIFGTRQEMTQHHHLMHGDITINYRVIDADVKPVVALICHCCQREVQPNAYVDHIKYMAKEQWNQNAMPLTWDGWVRRQEMQFLKTKVVFSNGLVLFKQNLICTDLGNHAGFMKLAKQIFDSLKKN